MRRTSPSIPRRTALTGLAGAAGSLLLPGCGGEGLVLRDDGTAPPDPTAGSSPGATSAASWDGVLPIDTMVLLMMENRSFDHLMGALSLEEGRVDVDGLDPTMVNPALDGTQIGPFALQDLCPDSPPHDWDSAHAAFDDGANDGFVAENELENGSESGAQAMGYHRRSQLPVHYALADGGTLCDRWFSSIMGPTWPNRMFANSGQSQAMKENMVPDLLTGATCETLWDRLDEAGISWGYYYSDLPFLLIWYKYIGRPEIKPISQYYEDAAAGTLPRVVWVDPGFVFNDDHPPHNIALGQALISSVFAALAASPHWPTSLFGLTYDEHGGFFDHVAPPKTADGLDYLGFDQLGFRVPALFAGPWVRQGAVSSVQYEHCSWMKQVETLFGLPTLTRRDEVASDLADVFDVDRLASGIPADPPRIPVVDVGSGDVGCTDPGADGGQPELAALFDQGLLPKEYDLRPRWAETLDTVLTWGERLGATRRR